MNSILVQGVSCPSKLNYPKTIYKINTLIERNNSHTTSETALPIISPIWATSAAYWLHLLLTALLLGLASARHPCRIFGPYSEKWAKAVATDRQLVRRPATKGPHYKRPKGSGSGSSRVTGQSLNRCTTKGWEISQDTLKDITSESSAQMPISQVFGHFYWLRKLSEYASTSTHSNGTHMRIRNVRRAQGGNEKCN